MNIYEQLVGFFGSQSKTAEALGISQSMVHKIVRDKSEMRAGTAIRAERATGGKFKAVELCKELSDVKTLIV